MVPSMHLSNFINLFLSVFAFKTSKYNIKDENKLYPAFYISHLFVSLFALRESSFARHGDTCL
jgi:hypothetical protein